MAAQGSPNSDVLIDENLVSVGVKRDQTGGTRRALIRLLRQFHALGLKTALEFAHVRECSQLLGITVPAGVEGEYIVVKRLERDR